MNAGKIIVFTGNGKGKTTSALGLGFERWTIGEKVLMLQFIKGERSYGEHVTINSLGDNFKVRMLGKGFFSNNKEDFELHKEYAGKALQEALLEIKSNRYDLVILDEINYAIHFKLLTEDQVIETIKQKPSDLTLVLTGRFASKGVFEIADEVYELVEIKHHSSQGLYQVKGIDY